MFQTAPDNVFASRLANSGSPQLAAGYEHAQQFEDLGLLDSLPLYHPFVGSADAEITSPLFPPFQYVDEPPSAYQTESHQEAPMSRESSKDLSEGASSRKTKSTDTGGEAYAILIYRALMSVPNHTMILQDIYDWFRNHTGKAKSSASKGWQNSIRHNLSMNEAFVKIEQDPAVNSGRKGYLWALHESAVGRGVESTTRYRKAVNKRAGGRESTAPPRPKMAIKGKRGSGRSTSNGHYPHMALAETTPRPDTACDVLPGNSHPSLHESTASSEYHNSVDASPVTLAYESIASPPPPARWVFPEPHSEIEWQTMPLHNLEEEQVTFMHASPPAWAPRSAGSTMANDSPELPSNWPSPDVVENNYFVRNIVGCVPVPYHDIPMFVDSEPNEIERLLLESHPCVSGRHSLDCPGYGCMV